MSTAAQHALGIRALIQGGYLPSEYPTMFRSQGMVEANFDILQRDITTLLPQSHPQCEAQKYHFAMMTYVISADNRLISFCQAALELSEEEWDICAKAGPHTTSTNSKIVAFYRTKRALLS